MNKLPVLIRRELQEHRGTMITLPVALVGFCLLVLLLAIFVAQDNEDGIEVQIRQDDGRESRVETREFRLGEYFDMRLQELADMSVEERERRLDVVYKGLSTPFTLVLYIVVFFYLLGSLYDDRRDRSVLFWKSMPVSDAMTVASKFAVAMVVAPTLYMVGIAVAHVLFLLLSSLGALSGNVDIWDTLWAQANIVSRWGYLYLYLLLSALWALPFFGWIVLVSAWARSVALVWVIAVPLGIVVIDYLFLPGKFISDWIGRHIRSFAEGARFDLAYVLEKFLSIDFAVSVIVAAAFIYLAILIRGRADEI